MSTDLPGKCAASSERYSLQQSSKTRQDQDTTPDTSLDRDKHTRKDTAEEVTSHQIVHVYTERCRK